MSIFLSKINKEAISISNYYTKEQVERAASVDIADMLRMQGEELIRSGDELRWKRHNSVTIRGCYWYRHKSEQGGNTIQFVQEFFNMDFKNAVEFLLDGEKGHVFADSNTVTKLKPPKPFMPPKPNNDMRRVYAYLMNDRFISREVISHFSHEKKLYESAEYNNAVFVGCDESGIPKNIHVRSTNSNDNFRINIAGSQMEYGFRHIGESDRLYVFEAPIDMLSFITLYPDDWKQHSYVALSGLSPYAVFKVLDNHTHVKNVCLCLDHDAAGIEGTYRIAESIQAISRYRVTVLRPQHKDWNEDLKAIRGLTAMPAEKHLPMEMFRDMCNTISKSALPIRVDTKKLTALLDTIISSGNVTAVTDELYDLSRYALALSKERMNLENGDTAISLMRKTYAPHKDKGTVKVRLDDIRIDVKLINELVTGTRTTSERDTANDKLIQLSRKCIETINQIVRLQNEMNQAADQFLCDNS